jgi:membrane protease YdiL (CAAX protease family)
MREPAEAAPACTPLVSAGLFFAAVFAWTWSFWFLAAALGARATTPLGTTLMHAGLLGPMLGGIGFTYFTGSNEAWRDYWRRVVDVRAIPARWLFVTVLFTPALLAVAVLVDLATGGTAVLDRIAERAVPFFAAPWTLPSFAAHVLVYGPIPEELGWRGYVLDRLQARWNALTASLILGVLWAVFHYPLFFIQDADPHHAQGAWSPWFWQFMIGIVPSAVIYTWIFNNTRRSTLAAILFHFASNFTYLFANTTPGTNLCATLLWVLAAIVVVACWGADTLRRSDSGLCGSRTPISR